MIGKKFFSAGKSRPPVVGLLLSDDSLGGQQYFQRQLRKAGFDVKVLREEELMNKESGASIPGCDFVLCDHLDLLDRERSRRQEAEEAKVFFRSLFESAPGLYLVVEPGSFQIVGVSDAYLRGTLTQRHEILGKTLFEVFPNSSFIHTYDHTVDLRASLERVKASEQPDVMAVQHYPIPLPGRGKGVFEDRYWSPLNSPVFSPDGELSYIIHRVEDVTEFVRLKRDEKQSPSRSLNDHSTRIEADIVLRSQELQRLNDQLRRSEERFRELAENVREVFFNFDPNEALLLYVSPAYEEVWGRSINELYANPRFLLDTIHLEDRMGIEDSLARCIAGQNVEVECRIYSPDGELRWIQIHCYPVHRDDGRVQHIVGTASDFTARKLAELDFARSNRALRMISACNEALIRVQEETTLLGDICRIAVDIGGYQMAWVGYAENDAQKTVVPVAHAGSDAGYLAAMDISWSEENAGGLGPAGTSIRSNRPVVMNDLEREPSFVSWMEAAKRRGYKGLICLPINNGEHTFGVLTLYSGEIRPVPENEIKLLQELAGNLAYGIAGLRSEQSRKQLQSAVLKVAAAVSAATGIEFFQQLVCNMAEALGAKAGFVARVQPQDSARARTIAAAVEGEVVANFDYLVEEGPCKHLFEAGYWMESSGLSQRYPEAPWGGFSAEAYVGMRLNNTSGDHLGQLFVIFSEPLKQSDFIVSTLKIFAARAAAELERREADARIEEQASLLDKAHDAIVVTGLSHDILFWNKAAERLYGWSAREVVGRSKAQLLYRDPEEFLSAWGELLAHGEWQGEVAQYRRDGEPLVVQSHWSLVRREDGEPKSVLAINSDITRRRAMEQQLQQSQRLKAVGELTGGVAHDFNNLLTVILGNTEVLAEELAGHPYWRELNQMTRSAAQRAAALTQRLLAFSRRQALEPRTVNVAELLANMHNLLRRTLRADINVRIETPGELWPALVDPAPLEAAILNLAINARDAMQYGGELTITAENAELDQRDIACADLAPGAYVVIEVADSGEGISSGTLKQVFEPFFTTKPKGEGTGLGLSIVYGFVKQSHGHVIIESEPGKGTRVRMYLPKAIEKVGRAPESLFPNTVTTEGLGQEKILLVEDDDLVRQFAQDQLLALGYEVITASKGAEALNLIQQMNDIDLLFTDVIMPGGMSGPELVDAAIKIRPGLKLLYTSGYTENAAVLPDENGIEFLSKPYSRATLARKIKAALSLS